MPAISILAHPEVPAPAPPLKPEEKLASQASEVLHVHLTREPWSDFFVLTLDNGHTEELEVEETRTWFRERGSDMNKIEKVLDQTWNFSRSDVYIDNPKEPDLPFLAHRPKL